MRLGAISARFGSAKESLVRLESRKEKHLRRRRDLARAIKKKTVTYDFHRLMEGATVLKCSEFGDAIIENMTASRT